MDALQDLVDGLTECEKRQLLELIAASLQSPSDVVQLYDFAEEMADAQLSSDQLWGEV